MLVPASAWLPLANETLLMTGGSVQRLRFAVCVTSVELPPWSATTSCTTYGPATSGTKNDALAGPSPTGASATLLLGGLEANENAYVSLGFARQSSKMVPGGTAKM